MPTPEDYGETHSSIAARSKADKKWRAHAIADDLEVSEEIVMGWLDECREKGLDIGLPRDRRAGEETPR